MSKQFVTLFICLLQLSALIAQEPKDFPIHGSFAVDSGDSLTYQYCFGSEVIHHIVSDSEVKELYCNGRLFAAGGVVLQPKTAAYGNDRNEARRDTFLRQGRWQTFYDSARSILLSEGYYKNGILDSQWTAYRSNGTVRKMYEFENGILKKEVEVDKAGIEKVVLSLSRSDLFFLRHQYLLEGLMLFIVVGIRSLWNIITFYKIKNTKHSSFYKYWLHDGATAALLSPFIFWWLSNAADSKTVKRYKRVGNVICAIAMATFVAFFVFLPAQSK